MAQRMRETDAATNLLTVALRRPPGLEVRAATRLAVSRPEPPIKWSARRTLALVIVFNCGAWAAIGLLLFALLR